MTILIQGLCWGVFIFVMDIARITNMDLLRQVATLQQAELARVHQRMQRMATRLGILEGDGSRWQRELFRLQQQLYQQSRRLFGDKSEKQPSAPAEPKAKKPQRGHGPTPQPKLRIEPVVHLLDDADRMCPGCGGAVVEMGKQFEESEEIDIVERHYVVKKHRRQKYRCQCCSGIETALGPVKLRPGNRYSVDFAVEVISDKFGYHIPWERQVRMMADQGLEVTSQSLWEQVWAATPHLQKAYDAIVVDVKSRTHVAMDETWWRMMSEKSKTGSTKRRQVWGMCCEDAAFYKILNSRSTDAAEVLLKDFDGVVMTDGFAVYQSLQKRGARYSLVHCWAHARRKFVDAEPFFPVEAQQMIEWIRQLYVVEHLCPGGPPEDPERLALLQRLRNEHSRLIMASIHDWLLHVRMLPESSLGKAVKYVRRFWAGLSRFLDDPRVELDNNRMERGLRGMALGRKNFYGNWSPKGARAAEVCYTLIESAKLSGANPKRYLRHVLGQSIEDRPILLPREFRDLNLESGP